MKCRLDLEKKHIYTIDEIKRALIVSCIESRPEHFKPYLLSANVHTEESKKHFFKFFKQMLASGKQTSTGEWQVKIKHHIWQRKKVETYDFFDATHKYPRLTIIIRESERSIQVEIPPF
jgi:hypothetical protein